MKELTNKGDEKERVHPLKLHDNFTMYYGQLENAPKALACASWMANYFRTCGDQVPNSDQVHLDITTMKEIYQTYVKEFQNVYSLETISYSTFAHIWRTVFRHVSIRKFKAVSGKCDWCAKLTDWRRKSQHPEITKLVTAYHAYHRITYMNERRMYYDKIVSACSRPDKYMSLIIDGMSQNHTQIPYIANLKQFESPLKTHLIGVIEHGQNFVSES